MVQGFLKKMNEEDMIPGKFIASQRCAFISWIGEIIRKTEYEVLVGNTDNWLAASDQNISPEAFHGGQIYDGERLFLGRLSRRKHITTGKVQKSHGICYIPYGDEKNQWIKFSNGQAPPGTLVGGVDITGEPIYIARASHNGDLIPGKMVASQRCAYISWGGLEFKKDEYEVLVGGSNNWIATKDSNVPDNALIAGKTDIGDTLYVGRVHFQGSITPGKVHKSQSVCYIPFDGKELRFSEYEVLLS